MSRHHIWSETVPRALDCHHTCRRSRANGAQCDAEQLDRRVGHLGCDAGAVHLWVAVLVGVSGGGQRRDRCRRAGPELRILDVYGGGCVGADYRDGPVARGDARAVLFSGDGIHQTEAVQVAIFGLIVLGDELSLARVIAILIATAGVFLIAVKRGENWTAGSMRPALYGVAAGGLYAIAAVGFRGGILSLDGGDFYMRATTTLVWSLALQSATLGLWMLVYRRAALFKSFALWRQSLFAGFMGAFASQFWFLGFSLTSAANVRTLGLIEVLFAQIVSRRVFSQVASVRELAGMALVVIGVAVLLAAT